MNRSGLACAYAHARSRARLYEREGKIASYQIRADINVRIRANCHARGIGSLYSCDIDNACSCLERNRVVPCERGYIHVGGAVCPPENNSRPSVCNAGEIGCIKIDIRILPIAKADRDIRSILAESQRSCTGQGGIEKNIRTRGKSEIVGAHRLNTVDGDCPRSALKGYIIIPCQGADIDSPGLIFPSKDKRGPAIRKTAYFGG